MNDEIKEILLEWKNGVETGKDRNGIIVGGCCYRWNELKMILDYITNLQQENERLKEWKEDLLKENIELENIRKEAIEYIEKHFEDDEGIICKITGKMECETNYNFLDNLTNILQNGSDEK